MRLQVTLSSRARDAQADRAVRLARTGAFEQVERGRLDLERAALVVGRERLWLRMAGRDFHWHPGLLHARLEAGRNHPLPRLLDLPRNPLVLDATLGFGIDAVFLCRVLEARVIGVERVPALALMTAEGLASFEPRVRVICAESGALLRSLPDRSVDAVYADPLFATRRRNPSLELVQRLGLRASLGEGWLEEALRVCRHRVVIKDDQEGALLSRLRAPHVEYTRVRTRYGVWSP